MIRRVQSARGRRVTGLYSIEGTRLVERALRAGAPLVAALVAERLARSTEPRYRELLGDLGAAGCPVTFASDSILAELTEGRDLGLILALVRLPPPITLSDLFNNEPIQNGQRQTRPSGGLAPPIFLAAVDIVDPGNVGALTRTAHASGAAALLVSGASDPFHPRATRTSRGSIFRLPVIIYETAPAMLADLRAHDVALVGTTATGGVLLSTMVWPGQSTAVLMGNEAEGLPPAVQAALDYNITIPMPDGVDSYSVNAAAAIILYTAGQERTREIKH